MVKRKELAPSGIATGKDASSWIPPFGPEVALPKPLTCPAPANVFTKRSRQIRLNRTLVSLTAAAVLASTVYTGPVLAEKEEKQPLTSASLAHVPAVTFQGMLSAGEVPLTASFLAKKEDGSFLHKLLGSILEGNLLPNIGLDDLKVAGVGGDQLAASYAEEAEDAVETEDSPDEDAGSENSDSAKDSENTKDAGSAQEESSKEPAPQTHSQQPPPADLERMGIPGTSPTANAPDQSVVTMLAPTGSGFSGQLDPGESADQPGRNDRRDDPPQSDSPEGTFGAKPSEEGSNPQETISQDTFGVRSPDHDDEGQNGEVPAETPTTTAEVPGEDSAAPRPPSKDASSPPPSDTGRESSSPEREEPAGSPEPAPSAQAPDDRSASEPPDSGGQPRDETGEPQHQPPNADSGAGPDQGGRQEGESPQRGRDPADGGQDHHGGERQGGGRSYPPAPVGGEDRSGGDDGAAHGGGDGAEHQGGYQGSEKVDWGVEDEDQSDHKKGPGEGKGRHDGGDVKQPEANPRGGTDGSGKEADDGQPAGSEYPSNDFRATPPEQKPQNEENPGVGAAGQTTPEPGEQPEPQKQPEPHEHGSKLQGGQKPQEPAGPQGGAPQRETPSPAPVPASQPPQPAVEKTPQQPALNPTVESQIPKIPFEVPIPKVSPGDGNELVIDGSGDVVESSSNPSNAAGGITQIHQHTSGDRLAGDGAVTSNGVISEGGPVPVMNNVVQDGGKVALGTPYHAGSPSGGGRLDGALSGRLDPPPTDLGALPALSSPTVSVQPVSFDVTPHTAALAEPVIERASGSPARYVDPVMVDEQATQSVAGTVVEAAPATSAPDAVSGSVEEPARAAPGAHPAAQSAVEQVHSVARKGGDA